DRMRGKGGAFEIALGALKSGSQNGLYPYIISVATSEFLQPDRFYPFMRFAAESGALEVHLLEPSPTGKLAGNQDIVLKQSDRQRILDYQKEIAQQDELPILSSFLLCPCNFVPLSFGNITDEPLQSILERMGCYFTKPRPRCVGQILAKHINYRNLPLGPEESALICEEHLPKDHSIPRFFQIRAEANQQVGQKEIQSAYDRIHEYYDEFWLEQAARPIEQLIERIPFDRNELTFEAGCGTGYGTLLIAQKLKETANIIAVDLSDQMLAQAGKRIKSAQIDNVRFIAGDALEILNIEGPFDLVFSSWVLGYIPLKPFFSLASRALKDSGRVAFVVHKENSPYEQLEIFGNLVAQDPSVLQKRVAFDFPRDMDHVRQELLSAGLEIEHLWDGKVVFRYDSAHEVLEHLLKSGAGTAYYDAVDPDRREALEEQFLKILAARKKHNAKYEVIHDYISCIAVKPQA
ncbi:MAG: methyltransferase domain-containing protein, partial [Planctomycetota bacterium]